ncbi:MAG: hypothetical protein GX265_03505 [Mollicutes bacterium]|nr:hypothetical protein [Mollicutes bacterium]
MLSKPLTELENDIKTYEEKLTGCQSEEEKNKFKKEFLNTLRLYLAQVNNLIKEIFKTEISPFKKGTGYDALYNNNVGSFTKKTKEEFLKEIDNIIQSEIYITLDESNKKAIDNALYVLKTYYEDSL